MIEQYRKDVSQIHASSELIQRTRAAMKQEEERLQEEEEVPGRRKSMKWDLVRYGAGRIAIPLVAAAAALLLVIAPGVIQRSIPQADTKIQMPGKLGQKGENYPVILKNGDNQTKQFTMFFREKPLVNGRLMWRWKEGIICSVAEPRRKRIF